LPPSKKIKTVLVFGTFDCLHPGHQNFFRQANKYGRVVVIVARDRNVQRIKNLQTLQNETLRLKKVRSTPPVAQAFLGDEKDFLQPVLKIKPDLIALGFDQKTFTIPTLQAQLKALNFIAKIIRLKSYQPGKFKSSLIRRKMMKNF
jgi:FAD synthetase